MQAIEVYSEFMRVTLPFAPLPPPSCSSVFRWPFLLQLLYSSSLPLCPATSLPMPCVPSPSSGHGMHVAFLPSTKHAERTSSYCYLALLKIVWCSHHLLPVSRAQAKRWHHGVRVHLQRRRRSLGDRHRTLTVTTVALYMMSSC